MVRSGRLRYRGDRPFASGAVTHWLSLVPAALVLTMLAIYFHYFQGANDSFKTGSVGAEGLSAELEKWAKWHWLRVALGLLAFFTSLLVILQNTKLHLPRGALQELATPMLIISLDAELYCCSSTSERREMNDNYFGKVSTEAVLGKLQSSEFQSTMIRPIEAYKRGQLQQTMLCCCSRFQFSVRAS